MKPNAADSPTTVTIKTYFSPRSSNKKGTVTRMKKAHAGTADKQAKTTQKPTDTMPLWHKSPTTVVNTPPSTKPSNMTPPMKQAPKVAQVTKTLVQNKEDNEEMTNDASTAMQHIMNASTITIQTQQNVKAKQQPNKTIFNLWKMVAAGRTSNNSNQGATDATLTDPPLKSHCHIKWWNQATGKGVKGVHKQKILNILEQLQKNDGMMTLYHFYSTNKNAPTRLYPLLKGKIKLPPDPKGMCQYCLGQPPPEQPGYTSIRIYLGHTKTLVKILAQTMKWMTDEQVQLQ